MEPPPRAATRDFPPLERTLIGLGPLPEAPGLDFGVTLGRASVSFGETLPASSLPRPPAVVIPEVSVHFAEAVSGGAGSAEGARESVVDLEVIGLLGEGGMGIVHLARQRSLEREVALKTTKPGAPETAISALTAEAVVTGSLEHPSIVPVHAFGKAPDGRPVLVMKRVEGSAWKELLRDPAHPLWESVGSSDRLSGHLRILAQVSNALAFAHARGVVHRDVKPDNVMIGSFGEVYLVDFGLSLRVDRGPVRPASIVGSPAYMAPEMVAGLEVDARTDVYLLGATLHEILTGRPPHGGATLVEVLTAAYVSEPPCFGEDVPEELAALCTRCLARHPSDRLESARAFRAALLDYLDHRGSVALARRGHERLAELEALGGGDEVARRARRSLLTECRFAFRQALAEWPGNRVARAGERRAIEAAVRLEIEDGHASAARAELESLPDPPTELVAALSSLEARLAREAAEKERLRTLERDLDARIGIGARRRAALAIAAVAATLSVYVIRSREDESLTSERLVPIAAFMVTAMTVLIALLHKRLFRNAFGVRITLLAYLSSWVMLGHRFLAAHVGQPVHVVLAFDSFLFTTMLVVTGITLARFLLVGALFTMAGSVAAIAFPTHAHAAFSSSTIGMLLAAALAFRPTRADEREEGEP